MTHRLIVGTAEDGKAKIWSSGLMGCREELLGNFVVEFNL